jgi:catechol 2,3-dioxygenase-like lactoylglutathione lyase family enzyme
MESRVIHEVNVRNDHGLPRISANLIEIALTSEDPRLLAEFYTRALGYEGGWNGAVWSGAALGRRMQLTPGPSNRFDYAAFDVPSIDDLDALRRRLAAGEAGGVSAPAARFLGDAIWFKDPDGNQLVFGVVAPEPTMPLSAIGLRAARLQHVVFATTDAQRLIDFYRGVVGFALSDYVVDDDGALTAAFLRSGDEHHSIAIFRAPTNRLDHFSHETGDWGLIRDWADHFAEQKVPLRWGPGRHGPGNNLFFFINDPDGNWLEFSAELELVSDEREVGCWPHEERTLNSWGEGKLRS